MDGHDMEVGFHDHTRTTNSQVVAKYGASPNNSGQNHNRTAAGGGKVTNNEKKLTVLVILMSILCFGLVAYVLVTGPLAGLLQKDSGGYVGICDSTECVEISHRAIESGDFDKDPCDDFYSFACSKWQNNNPTSQELFLSAANIHQIKDGVDFYIKRLLEKPEEMRVNATTGLHVYSSPKAFYESCLHFSPPAESRIISDLIKPFGGYKTLANWSEKDFDLTSTVLAFLRMNAAPLFDLTLDINPKDKSKYALIVELPRPTSLVPNLFQPQSRQEDILMSDKLNSELTEASNNNNAFPFNGSGVEVLNGEDNGNDLYPTTMDRQILYKMITENVEIKRVERLQILTEQIGNMINMPNEEIQDDIKSMSVLAATIEKIKPSHRSRKFWKQQNKVYNAFSLESLQRLFNNVDWKQLLERLLNQKKDGIRKKVDIENFSWENITLYVPYPDYLRRLSQAIQFTDKRTLLNGMLVMYVKDMLNDINPKKKDTEIGNPRWKFCVHSTISDMRSFDPALLSGMKDDVENIFEGVRETLLEFLNQSHWQDTRSREESIKKIKSIKGSFIGPDFYLKSDYLEDGIKNEIKVQIDPKNFIANIQLVYKVFRKQLYALYFKRVDVERATWSFVTFPTTVNAFYIQQFNSLVVPLAFLNPPNYSYGAPKYVNYATIALTIAHEALHSLDSSGSDFDADGKLNHNGIHTEQRGFLKEKSSCVAKQYFDMFRKIIPFHHSKVNMYFQVDGNLTQNENLADIAGLQVAFSAYQKHFAKSGGEWMEKMKLPGLRFSRDQMYYLSVAQAYCANISPMGYIFLLEMDEHTPHPERINGMLMNIPEFSNVFRCGAGSRMNPDFKCSMW
ncbi:Phosphate-regulating neutral endopeptidase [Folsomia candida]|uniref:Phosphate-regulating neutral endopeptidase n=1 Tax=Folsomia candida TaxID=158441 RepID=A0A226ES53_FOLCA|nr:Phosphate-regulating neutral endopeptidase [Folsomia candida]